MGKLAIGTAQFGFNYGIANRSGQVSLHEAVNILQLARNADIDLVDTAIGYGDSEKVLGRAGATDFKVVSKLPIVPASADDIGAWVENEVRSSINRLGVSSLYALLLHNPEDLLGYSGRSLSISLNDMKAKGLVHKVGISIYDPTVLGQIIPVADIDIIQAPLNLVDRRLEHSGWLERLHSQGIEVHTRSVFLQGLLLITRSNIPKKFDRWRDLWDRWDIELKKCKFSALAACLSYPLSLKYVDRVVVGVDSTSQIESLISCSGSHLAQRDWSFMNSNDLMLIDPSNWVHL